VGDSTDKFWPLSGTTWDALRIVANVVGFVVLRYINRYEDLLKENEELKRKNAHLAAANKFGIPADTSPEEE
jgi:hypothetical protein